MSTNLIGLFRRSILNAMPFLSYVTEAAVALSNTMSLLRCSLRTLNCMVSLLLR